MLIIPIDPTGDLRLAARLLDVQHSSYRIEAELIGVDTIPQLHETLDGLLASGLDWLAAFESAGDSSASPDDRPGDRPTPDVLGALAWSEHDEGDGRVIEIERLVVAPAHFRRGIAKRLVGEAISLAGGRPITVSTGRDNPPARRLYESMGFAHAGDLEVAPSVHLAQYELHTG